MERVRISNPRTVFLAVWCTELVSAFGTGLTGFALGVVVYLRTGSTTQFALVLVFTTIPTSLLSPFFGALADRWDRRLMMLTGNAVSGLIIAACAALQQHGGLAVWQIYLAVAVLAVCAALRDPAYYASVSQMVSKEQLGRASGLVQTAENIGEVAPPLVAGALLVAFGLSGVLAFDLVSYGVGVAGLLAVRFPRLERVAEPGATKSSLWHDTAAGWSYLVQRRGYLYLALFGTFLCFCLGLTQILVTPLVLSFGSAAVLGATFSIGGLGIFVGGVVVAAWGGFRRRIRAVLVFGLAQALFLFVAGLRPSAVVIAVGLFGYLFCIQFNIASIATIIRENVPHGMQARVFALDSSFGMSALPVAYVLAGPLVNAFDPLLTRSGPLAGTVGRLVGTGSGRGIGFLIVTLSASIVLVTLVSYANPRLRSVEVEMRAADPDTSKPDTSAPAEADARVSERRGGNRS